jgi:putative SOS response-associated peptidase YedK
VYSRFLQPGRDHRAVRVVNRYVGNLSPMPGVFPDYPAPVIRNTDVDRELTMMRWGMPPPPKFAGPPVTNIRNTSSPTGEAGLKPENRCLVPVNSFAEYRLRVLDDRADRESTRRACVRSVAEGSSSGQRTLARDR